VSGEYADVGGNTITELDFDDVTGHELLRVHVQLLTVTYHDRKLHTASGLVTYSC